MFIFVCDVHVLCENLRLQKPSNAYKSQKLGRFVFFNVLGNMQKIGTFKPAVFFGLRFHSFKGVYVTATIVHVFNNTLHYVT